MNIIGIDNGVTGSVAIIRTDGSVVFDSMPVKKCLSYTKTKAQWIHRIDVVKLREILTTGFSSTDMKVYLERPMINPRRWKASMSAVRALEATLIVLEDLRLPYEYIDSKAWQKELLPHGVHKDNLKTASKEVAIRLFPSVDLAKRDDGDGLLIAEFGRRNITKGESK